MKMLLTVEMPNEPFNTLVRQKKAGALIGRILEEIKPEAVYFTEYDGQRGGVMVVEVAGPSDVPRLVEPFFLNFNASCKFRIAMTPEDLAKSGLDTIADKWA